MKRYLLLFFLGLSQALSAQWNTYNMLQMGKSAIYFDDYISAIENFNNIIRIKPYLSEPYFFRGLAKMNLDDYEGAIKDYTQAIELNPNYFHAYMYRGIAYHNLRKFKVAMQDYNMAISIDPGNAYVYANRGMTRAETGDFKGAEKDYSKSLLIDDKLMAAYLNRAIMREKMDDLNGAMADCNAAVKLNMFSDDAYGLRGYLWYKQKNYHNAVEDYNRALKANPKNERLLMSRAMVWYEMKKYQETLDDYTRIIEIDSNYIYAFYNRAMLLAEIGDYNQAIADLDRAVEMNPDNILIYFNRGLLKLQVKDLPGAYDDFSESIRLYPDFVKAYMMRSVVNGEMQDYASADNDTRQAKSIMERYRKMKEGDKNALVDTAENFQRLIDFNARTDKMRDVINGRVQDKNVIVSLQEVFCVQYQSMDSLRTGKFQYYNRHITDFNQRHDYNPALALSNKHFNYSPELVESRIEELTRQLKEREDEDLYLLRGIFYMAGYEYPKALDDFAAILKKNPDNLLAVFNMANARMLMYDYIGTIDEKASRHVVGEENKEAKIVVDYSQVLAGYDRCLELDPAFIYALFNIANVYVKNERIEQAIDTYTSVIAKDRDMAEAYFNRGLLYIYIGRKAEANADLSKAGEIGIPEAYNIIKRYCKEK